MALKQRVLDRSHGHPQALGASAQRPQIGVPVPEPEPAAARAPAHGLERLGYRFTMLVALLFLVWLVERRGFALAAVFALGMAFGSFYLFDTLLRVPLPRGPWGV